MMFPNVPASLLTADPASILVTAASCCLVAATAPLAIELLALTAGSLLPERWSLTGQRTPHPHTASRAPFALTVIVPAHNEEALVGRCVSSLLADLPLGGSVLVVAHNCSDSTAVIASDAGAEILILDDEGHQGKGAALRAGLARAVAKGAEVLAVVDADSVVAPGFSAAIAQAIERGAEAFQARYVVLGGEHDAQARLTALGFLGFNVVRPRGRSRLGLSAGIFGNGFGFRRSVLERVPYEASSVVEDLEYHLRLVERGIRVHFLEAATVSSEMPSTAAAASSQRARWEGGRLRMAQVWLPRMLRSALRGKWGVCEPALELIGLPLASEVLLLALALLLPVPWLRMYAIAAFAVLLAHVAAAAAEGNWWTAVRTLLSVPRYILWKLRMLPRTLASSRRNASWVRTVRETPVAPTLRMPLSAERTLRTVTEHTVGELVAAGPVKGVR